LCRCLCARTLHFEQFKGFPVICYEYYVIDDANAVIWISYSEWRQNASYQRLTPIFFFSGSTAPWGPRPPHFSRLHDHTLDTPQSVWLLWTSDQPVAETST
jgi:hypothetical protein